MQIALEFLKCTIMQICFGLQSIKVLTRPNMTRLSLVWHRLRIIIKAGMRGSQLRKIPSYQSHRPCQKLVSAL